MIVSITKQADQPSYVNTAVRVPTTPVALTSTSSTDPSPAADMHDTDDADAHDVVAQPVAPIRPDAEEASVPKLRPDTVTL